MADAKKPCVLIVEDEYPILKGVAAKFAIEGFEVLSAQDGKDGLHLALTKHPDMILMDYRMPVMDGFEALARLRGDRWGKDAKVIMWTNSFGLETKARAQQFKVLDFIVKSDMEYRDVIARVRQLLSAAAA